MYNKLESMNNRFSDLEPSYSRDIYEEDFVEELLEDDALSFEEAAFMNGYSQHN